MSTPVFGFLAFTAGSYEGAIIRDTRLANALHRRGFKVVIYWAMETNPSLVDPGIRQDVLFRGARYFKRKPSSAREFFLGRAIEIFPQARRRRFMQQNPRMGKALMENFVASMCDGAKDEGPVQRLETLMARDGVTHLLPTFVMTCPIALAAKERGKHSFDYLATFQGEEIFANYAQSLGRLQDYYAQLRRCVAGTPWPAIAVSDDYAVRLRDEMGIDFARMVTIYPGIELPIGHVKPDFSALTRIMPGLDPNIPIITYFGRQDTEKGIDLLLYATRMAKDRGVNFQLVICGGSAFGRSYQDVCEAIADHLRLVVFWKRRVSDEVRSALYAYSRAVVYPSIHREPFGMVAAETMSFGTPVIVPASGGVAEAILGNGKVGGLTFKIWDTHDLADQLERMVTDDALHASLAGNTREIAAQFSVDRLADKILKHMGLPEKP